MEEIKQALKSPKKTAKLGLICVILILVIRGLSRILARIPYFGIADSIMEVFDIYYILTNIYYIGLIVYFAIVLLRMNKKKIDIKIANYTLIVTSIIQTLWAIGNFNLFTIVFYVITILYFCNIFLRKPQLINNKVFAIVQIGYMGIGLLINFGLLRIIITLAYLLSMIYFYNYYEILIGGKENGQ